MKNHQHSAKTGPKRGCIQKTACCASRATHPSVCSPLIMTPIVLPRNSPRAQIEEGQLRKVVRLVTADSDYDEDMSRAEVHRAAGQLLATPGNLVRFHKSLAQLDAKRRWSALSEQDRQPWEERAAAETSRWNEWKAAEASTASASAPQAAGKKKDKDSADAKGDTGAAAKKKDKEKDAEGGGGKGGGGKGGKGGGGGAGGGGEPSSKRAKKESDGGADAKKAAKSDAKGGASATAAEKGAPARSGSATAAAATRAATAGRSNECPELGFGWVCVVKRRANATGAKVSDKVYISPEGERFTSRVKVLKHLGLEVDPLDGAAKPPKAPRAMTKRERAKARVAEARARLHATLARSQKAHEERLAAEAESDKGGLVEMPEPDGRLPIAPAELAGEAMALWSFASSFERVLNLSAFRVDDFLAALNRTDGTPSGLLSEIHTRLLRGLLSDVGRLRAKHQAPPPLGVPLLLQQVPHASAVTPTSWPEVLRTVCCLLREAAPETSDGAAALRALSAPSADYYADVTPPQKLALLSGLTQVYLDLGEAGPLADRVKVEDLLKGHFESVQGAEARARRDAEGAAKRDAAAAVAAIEARRDKRIGEATKAVSSEALAAQMAAMAALEEAASAGRGSAAMRARAEAEAKASAPVPTVPLRSRRSKSRRARRATRRRREAAGAGRRGGRGRAGRRPVRGRGGGAARPGQGGQADRARAPAQVEGGERGAAERDRGPRAKGAGEGHRARRAVGPRGRAPRRAAVAHGGAQGGVEAARRDGRRGGEGGRRGQGGEEGAARLPGVQRGVRRRLPDKGGADRRRPPRAALLELLPRRVAPLRAGAAADRVGQVGVRPAAAAAARAGRRLGVGVLRHARRRP